MANVVQTTSVNPYSTFRADEYPLQTITGIAKTNLTELTAVKFDTATSKWAVAASGDAIEGIAVATTLANKPLSIYVSGSFDLNAITVDASVATVIKANSLAVFPIFFKNIKGGM